MKKSAESVFQEYIGRKGIALDRLGATVRQLIYQGLSQRVLGKSDIQETLLQTSWFEEGEHAVTNGLERNQRQAAGGKSDFLHLFIKPEHREKLQRLYRAIEPLLVRMHPGEVTVSGVLTENDEGTYFNIACGELWGELRSSIKAMEHFIDQGEFAAACFTFWRYFEKKQFGSALLKGMVADEKIGHDLMQEGFDPVNDLVHDLTAPLLSEIFSGDNSLMQLIDSFGRAKIGTFYNGQTADLLLKVLKQAEQTLLNIPYGLQYQPR